MLRQWFDKVGRAGSCNDLTTIEGLIVAIKDTLRIRRGGLMHGGHPCNGLLVGNTILRFLLYFSYCKGKDVFIYEENIAKLRFVFMSMGTHWRHLCSMGHPGILALQRCN